MVLLNTLKIRETEPLFQVIFLGNEDQDIWIDEVDKINFKEIRRHLKSGYSVFITSKTQNKLLTSQSHADHADHKTGKDCEENAADNESVQLFSSILSEVQLHKFPSK